MAELLQPLCELLSSKKSWVWELAQDATFEVIKAELARPTTLALYSPEAPTKIAADASAYGMGTVSSCNSSQGHDNQSHSPLDQ